MPRKFTLILAGLATAAAVAFGGASIAADAATPACQAVPGHACTSYVTPAGGGLALDVYQQRTAADTPVIVYTASQADQAEDFTLKAVPVGSVSVYGYAGSQTGTTVQALVTIEYTPDGVASGMCVSDIDPAAGQAAELRPCTDTAGKYNPFQAYVELQAGTGDGQFVVFQDSPVSLEGMPTGLYLADGNAQAGNGTPGNRVPVQSVTAPQGGPFTEAQIWEAGNG